MKLNLSPAIEAAQIEFYRLRFEGGDEVALIQAIGFCFAQEIVAPEWIVGAFCEATNKWFSMRAKTLDEAFGVRLPKGAHFHALKQRRRLKVAVWNAVQDAKNRGRAINDKLFAEVGKSLRPPIGKSRAKEYYKAAGGAIGMTSGAVEMLLGPYVLCSSVIGSRNATKVRSGRKK